MKRLDDKWYPIAELPEEFKDQRRILVWCDYGEGFQKFPTIAEFYKRGNPALSFWMTPDGTYINHETITHFREIVSPQEEAMRDYHDLRRDFYKEDDEY